MYCRLLFAFLAAAFEGSAATSDVCDVLSNLDEFNGRVVVIRGILGIGHTGPQITSDHPCTQPVIRQGWQWREFLGLYVRPGGSPISAVLPRYRSLARANVGYYIVGTVTGILTVPAQYSVQDLDYSGSQRPIGFHGSAVGALLVKRIDDLEPKAFAPSVEEWLLELFRRPDATRPRPTH